MSDRTASAEDVAVFAPVPVLRPREQIEDQIRRAILSGQLVNGYRLPSEAALATEFSVSRTTVREALRSLAAQGMITKVPGSGGGSFVRSVDHWSLGRMLKEGIENLLQLGTIEEAEAGGVRQMLEIPAARLAAKHRTETELVRLDHILEQLRAASIDDPAIAALDIEFHTTIALASGNRVLACLVFALHRATEPVLHLSLTTEVGRESHRQHLRLAKAIRDGDSDAAEAAITDHLSYLEAHPRRLADDLFRPSAGR